jgi:hypothetical protein
MSRSFIKGHKQPFEDFTRDIKILVFQWNVGNERPHESELTSWLPEHGGDFDLVVVGTQENKFKERGNLRHSAVRDDSDDEHDEHPEEATASAPSAVDQVLESSWAPTIRRESDSRRGSSSRESERQVSVSERRVSESDAAVAQPSSMAKRIRKSIAAATNHGTSSTNVWEVRRQHSDRLPSRRHSTRLRLARCCSAYTHPRHRPSE